MYSVKISNVHKHKPFSHEAMQYVIISKRGHNQGNQPGIDLSLVKQLA